MELLGALGALKARQHAEERDLVRRALVSCDWNLSAAARALGIYPSLMQRTLERHPDVAAERNRRRVTALRAA